MGAREAAQAAISRFEKVKRPKLRVVRAKAATSFVIICPRCVALGREKTEHRITIKSRWCDEHRAYGYTITYRRKNRDKANAARRRQYAANPHKQRAMCRANYKKNRAKRIEYFRHYNAENKEQKNAYDHAYRARKIALFKGLVQIMPTIIPAECF